MILIPAPRLFPSLLPFNETTPLANLFVTMLDRLGVPAESFADSTGEMSEVLA